MWGSVNRIPQVAVPRDLCSSDPLMAQVSGYRDLWDPDPVGFGIMGYMARFKPVTASLFALALFSVLPASAAVPPRSPENLKENATDIVVGQVVRVYAGTREVREGMTDDVYVAEVKVTAAEKGDLAAGKVVFARYWKPKSRPRGWAGPQGQNVLPAEGKTVRLFLVRAADGGLDVLTPNGVAVVEGQ